MKRLMLVLAAVPLSLALQAQANEMESFSIPCPATGLPDQAEVVRVFDEHNLGKVYELRQRVRTLAWRECRGGAAFVQIVAAPGKSPRALAYGGHAATGPRLASSLQPPADAGR